MRSLRALAPSRTKEGWEFAIGSADSAEASARGEQHAALARCSLRMRLSHKGWVEAPLAASCGSEARPGSVVPKAVEHLVEAGVALVP
jgi:hypothetical protein